MNLLMTAACESGLNVLTDFMILGLALKVVWSIRIPLKQKILVASTFLLGGACVP